MKKKSFRSGRRRRRRKKTRRDWKTQHPTNNSALLIDFLLSSDAEIFV